MSMDIDPARRDQQAIGIDFPLARAGLAANLSELVAIHRHIAGIGRFAGTIDDRTASDHRITHGLLPFLFFRDAMGKLRAAAVKFPGLAGILSRNYFAARKH